MIEESKQKMSVDDFTSISTIGQGSYAKVLLVEKNETKKLFAMKILKKEKVEQRKQEKHVRIERDVLIDVEHPFVIKFYYSFQNDRKLYFILEYCPGILRPSYPTRRRTLQPSFQEETFLRDLDHFLCLLDDSCSRTPSFEEYYLQRSQT